MRTTHAAAALLLSTVLGGIPALLVTGVVVPARADDGPDRSDNVELVATIPLEWEPDPEREVVGPTYTSELAFQNRLMVAAVQGNHAHVRGAGDQYESGLATFRVARTGDPMRQLGSFRCHSVGELSLWGDLVLQGAVRSTEASHGLPRDGCDRNGFRLIDVSNARQPRAAAFIPVSCGVVDHALVPAGRRLYAYVPATCNQQTETFTNAGVFGEISVFRIWPEDPARSGQVGIVDLLPMNGCSEIAVSIIRHLAVCAANVDNRFGLLDISDPAAPELIEESVTASAWSYSSPTFTWDGSHLVMAADPAWATTGATPNDVSLRIFNIEDVTNPVEVGTWTAPDLPGGDANVYSITSIPMRDERQIIAVAHANFGFWVLDITDPAAPREVGYHVPDAEDVQPDPTSLEGSLGESATITAYWHNGRFYASNLGPLQVFRVRGFNRNTTHFYKGSYNAQTLLPAFQ